MVALIRSAFLTFLVSVFSVGAHVVSAQDASARSPEHLTIESNAFPEFRTGRNLRAEASSAKGDIHVGFSINEHAVAPPPGLTENPYDNHRIKALASVSDLIVVGRITSKESFLSADGSFVFTHYDVTSDVVLQNRTPMHIRDGVFYLTAPGGNVALAGHNVNATVSNVPQLAVGQTYILFLAYSSLSDSFQLASNDVFKLGNGVVTPLRAGVKPPNEALLNSEANYLDAIRANIRLLAQAPTR